jgi:glycine betaine/proline transport system substrate-binding protein
MIRSTRRLTRLGVLLTIALLALLSCSGKTATVDSGSASEDKNLKIALSPGFDEDIAVTYLWKELLEKRGYSVEIQELEVGQSYVGVAQNQVDLYLDAWLPTAHQPYWEKFEDELEIIAKWYSPAALDLAVPNYMTDVNTLEDLKGRESEFGNRIVGIEPGTGLMRLTKEAVIPDYGLEGYQLLESSTPAMLSSLEQAIAAQEPVVVTLWTPHWAFTKFPIKALQDPKGAFGKPDAASVVASKDFAKAHPEVAGWLGKFKLNDEQLGSLELLIREKGDGNEQKAAAEWITHNEEVINSWFSSPGA